MDKTVQDVMHKGVFTCNPETPIPDVAGLMYREDISAVPVVNTEGHLIGIVSRTDLIGLRAHAEWEQLCAEHAMTHEVVTITADQPLYAAVSELAGRRLHRLVVVAPDGNGRLFPIGVVSQTDIVREMSGEL
jgi:CBS domain-containing protein